MSQVLLLRRSVLAALGLGGFALAFDARAAAPGAPANKSGKAGPAIKPGPAEGLRPNLFVHVRPDGNVDIVCHRSEMGQGVRSTLPVLVADELGADPARVNVVQADGDKAYGDQNTDGSHSIRGQFESLRSVGAAARIMLVRAAATRWGVEPASCTARDHRVRHEPSGRTLGFAELVAAAAKLPVPTGKAIVLRPRSELKYLGKDLPLRDGADIVSGRARFGADVTLPGMLTAVIARPPVVGGRVQRFDATKALAVPGVRRVVELPAPKPPFAFQALGGVAVLAAHTWAALRGRAALDVVWSHGANASYDSVAYRETLRAAVRTKGTVTRDVGDVEAALGKASKTIEAEYDTAHLAHAPMEPPCAIARIEDGLCEVWAPTQNPQAARTSVAKALGVDESKVAIHVTLLGGGFGRKSKPDYCVEAALLARAAKAPVRVQWTREDDIQHDYYHSCGVQKLSAGLDAEGKLVALRHRTAFPPIATLFGGSSIPGADELQQGLQDLPLAVPNVRIESGDSPAYTRIGWLRSVHNIRHAFATQSFLCELAHARGIDPKAMVLESLGPPRKVSLAELGLGELKNYGQSLEEHPIDTARHHRVVERVTELCRWSSRAKDGRALGLAVHRSFLAYVAVVISVVRRPDGRLYADEAWIVADVGTVVNRERVHSQLEGAVLFGIGQAFYGNVTMKEGRTVQSNFRDYRLLRLGEAPRAVHVDVIPSEGPPAGVGEPGVPPVAPALANAIFALTGTRVRELPLCNVVRA